VGLRTPLAVLVLTAVGTALLASECRHDPSQPPSAGAPPGELTGAISEADHPAKIEDVHAVSPGGPCVDLTELVAGAPTEESLPRLLSMLETLPAECAFEVPRAWQIAAAIWVCSDGRSHGAIPGIWAFRAIESGASIVTDRLPCLLGRAAEVGQDDAGKIARVLARMSSGKMRVMPSGRGVRADQGFLDVLQAMLVARPPEDLAWWRGFWRGIPAQGAELRPYLYLAAGREFGFDTLRDFIEASIEWDEWSREVPATVAKRAGWVLRDFRGDGDLSVARMFPPSARMRRVLLNSIPFRAMSPLTDTPWLGSDAAQERLRQLWRESGGGEMKIDLKGWRVDYIAHQWDLAGDAVALRDLRSVFGESAQPIPEFGDEQWIRFATALRAYTDRTTGVRRRDAQSAPEILSVLEAALERATPRALTDLASRLKPQLEDPEMRAAFASLVQDRLQELPDSVASDLTR